MHRHVKRQIDDAERIYGAEGFIFPPGRQLLARTHINQTFVCLKFTRGLGWG